jgi:hypothetical protein
MARPELDKLTQEVTESTTVMGSAAALLNGLGAALKQVKEELAATGVSNDTLNSLSSELDAKANELAEAVAANTAAEDETPEGGGTEG